MIILLKENANARQVDNLKKFLTNRGFDLHISEGTQHTLIGLIGDTSKLDIDLISSLDVVESVRRIQEPYKNANRKFHTADTVVDVGGDDRGALALGRLSPALREENNYDMRFVVNFYRPLTQTAEAALGVMREVEAASGLRFTGILNNSNLGAETTAADIRAALERARRLSERAGLPIAGTCAREDLAVALSDIDNLIPVRLRFRTDWAIF